MPLDLLLDLTGLLTVAVVAAVPFAGLYLYRRYRKGE
jgi:hypothetical protein